jgi:hypothetical protein
VERVDKTAPLPDTPADRAGADGIARTYSVTQREIA